MITDPWKRYAKLLWKQVLNKIAGFVWFFYNLIFTVVNLYMSRNL